MAAKKGTKAESIIRAREFARIIANGGRRSDCIKYAEENWGLKESACNLYLQLARDQLKADWDVERPQMVADLLSQCATLQQEARAKGQYHIALGAINTAAKLAQLCS
tara:strand:- start:942 stop:1265 length:324 start_codon:yes stop_codon:yes gene_type:complete